jgi:hypothetical protein
MPGEMPAPEQASGGASQLVSSIHTQMSQLMQMMGQSPAVGDEDKQKLAQLIQGFESFVEGLGSAPGKNPQPGNVPSEAGVAEVKPAM